MNRFAPIPGARVTSGFRTSSRPTHEGTDYAAAIGTPVHAALDGTVTLILVNDPRAGNCIQLQHSTNPRLVTGYAHLSEIDVLKGQKVSGGSVIGKSGNTGNSTGPHLHFIVKPGKDFTDPVKWLKEGAAAPGTPTPEPAPAPAHSGPVVLSWGSQGPEVEELQRTLNAWYPHLTPLVVDGRFGDRTGDRVEYLQRRANIAPDRRVGPITKGVLHLTF